MFTYLKNNLWVIFDSVNILQTNKLGLKKVRIKDGIFATNINDIKPVYDMYGKMKNRTIYLLLNIKNSQIHNSII